MTHVEEKHVYFTIRVNEHVIDCDLKLTMVEDNGKLEILML